MHDLTRRALLTQGAGDRATAHALNVAVIALLMGRVDRSPQAPITAKAPAAAPSARVARA